MSDSLRPALDRRLALLRAHEAARAGDLERAARLLDDLGDLGSPGSPGNLENSGNLENAADFENAGAAEDAQTATALLDLRARVHAQRGELDEADRCWARVQELAPEDPDAAEGRRTVARIQQGRRRARPVIHTGWAAIGAAALAVTALVLSAAWVVPMGVDRLTEPDEGRASARAQQARAEAQRAQVEAQQAQDAEQRLRARQKARVEASEEASTRRERAVDEIAESLEIPGTQVRRDAETISVVFDEGVFLYDTVPRESSPDLLRELGGQLAEMDVDVTVVGHSVPVPGHDTSGGSVLAQQRARVAAEYLADGGDLPLTALTLAVADQDDGPFEEASRNRTVSLSVQPELSG